MANIFRKKDQYIDRVNRSTFDLSFVNNLTMKFGAITPVCCLPVGFGDSFQINARFNLQLLPTVFPIQTQLYVRLHFVYVRTRTIWKDWMTFFGGDESVTPPWMNLLGDSSSSKFSVADDLQTGTLSDYLGVPTTLVGSSANVRPTSFVRMSYFNYPSVVPYPYVVNGNIGYSNALLLSETGIIDTDALLGKSYNTIFPYFSSASTVNNPSLFATMPFDGTDIPVVNNTRSVNFKFLKKDGTPADTTLLQSATLVAFDDKAICIFAAPANTYLSASSNIITVSVPTSVIPSSNVVSAFGFIFDASNADTIMPSPSSGNITPTVLFESVRVITNVFTDTIVADKCPFYTGSSETLPPIPLSALPFRAYEAYYNAFGRDIRNNPFIVDGKPEYNRYVPSVDGGPDSYKYQLHYANWEPDAYTTALQSPQSGVAPLVGITSLGEATFRDAAGTTYTAQLETAEDGDTVTGFQMKSSNAPADVVRNLIGMATSGISISDFRNVNSLQRFLEIRIRQSPRYKNLVKGLFDVNLDYDELMMPEFLGGISDTIPVYKVTQTTPTDDNPLGSFAGQGSLQSGMRHVIRKYCPEDGYILGVMSVVPAANYSQLLPPHFTRMNLLDWHFPQFNNISYQPMLYKHLCPYQAYASSPGDINNVFGYQRAYWDLISSFDEVHGQFRSSMRNFVINRVFDKAPELSQDFLLVNPDHVNDVFAMTTEDGDKILGSIAFDITKKTTIPRNSIPHIE